MHEASIIGDLFSFSLRVDYRGGLAATGARGCSEQARRVQICILLSASSNFSLRPLPSSRLSGGLSYREDFLSFVRKGHLL